MSPIPHTVDLSIKPEVAAFFDAIRKNSAAPVLADFADALRTQRTVDAIRRSLGSGRIELVD